MDDKTPKARNLVFGRPFTREAVDRMNRLMRAYQNNDEVEQERILDEIWEGMQASRAKRLAGAGKPTNPNP